jgi:two-component system response regulator FixJ
MEHRLVQIARAGVQLATGPQQDHLFGSRDAQRGRDLSGGQVVHVIDDDTDVRQAVTFALEAAGLSVQMHESAEAFLDAEPKPEAGCIVTDVIMPGMDGLDLQRKLRADRNYTPIIIMTGHHSDVALTVEVMEAGAFAVFEKPFDNDGLLEAVRLALARHHGVRERRQRFAGVRHRLGQLSERERQVLDGLAAGKLNKTIAEDLGLSVRTVEGYRANILAKMRAPSLSGLVRMVLGDPTAG